MELTDVGMITGWLYFLGEIVILSFFQGGTIPLLLDDWAFTRFGNSYCRFNFFYLVIFLLMAGFMTGLVCCDFFVFLLTYPVYQVAVCARIMLWCRDVSNLSYENDYNILKEKTVALLFIIIFVIHDTTRLEGVSTVEHGSHSSMLFLHLFALTTYIDNVEQ